jgi:hypothetical protein
VLLEENENRRKALEQNGFHWKKPVFASADGKRKLRALNALFLAFSRAGCQATLHGREELEPGVVVGDTHVSFKLDPLSGSRTAQRHIQSQKVEMNLSVNCWWNAAKGMEFAWSGSDQSSIEDQLADIASGIIVAREIQYREGMRRYQWLVERKHAAEEALRKKTEEEQRIILQKQLEVQKQQREWSLH